MSSGKEVAVSELQALVPGCKAPSSIEAPFMVKEVIVVSSKTDQVILVGEDGRFIPCNFQYTNIPFSLLIDAGLLSEAQRHEILDERGKRQSVALSKEVLRRPVERAETAVHRARQAAKELPEGSMTEVIEGLKQDFEEKKKSYEKAVGEKYFFDTGC